MILILEETSSFYSNNEIKSWVLVSTSLLFCSCRLIILVHRGDLTGAGGDSVSKMLGSLYFSEILC